MQKLEIIDAILTIKRENPKITNNEIATKLSLHRNTISKYINYIRTNYHKTSEEIVNKIDQRLEEELDTMSHKALLAYRSQLVPRKQEIKSEHKEEITHLNVEEINVTLSNYRDSVQAIVDRYIQKDNP